MEKIIIGFIIFILFSCTSQTGDSGSSTQSSESENHQPNDKWEKHGNDKLKEDNNKSSNLNITYTMEQSNLIDSTFGLFKLSSEDLEVIKKIYADPDPDPENKEGLNCGFDIKKCSWCSNEFNVEKTFKTYKRLVEKFTNPLTSLFLEMNSMLSIDNSVSKALHMMCNNFKAGQKYECSSEGEDEFCSERCKWEAKNH